MNVRLTIKGDTLSVGGLRELNSANAEDFRDQVRTAMSDGLRVVDIDLSQATFMDSCGLGALISLHRSVSSRSGLVRLRNPATQVRHLLELTRMRRIFEIVDGSGCGRSADGLVVGSARPESLNPVSGASSGASIATG
jgi:anti-sigma B factor antagonist